jgi:microcystin-dependent protein
MSTPYLSEIRIMGFNFPPKGWAMCNGQLVAIQQNQALFALLGTTYGGDGQRTFQLPDLRSRTPISFGQGPGLSAYALGQIGGVENVTIDSTTMPAHGHGLTASSNPADPTNGINPANSLFANTSVLGSQNYVSYSTPKPLNAAAIFPVGGNQPHSNIQPYLVVNFCIALQGVFPSRN